MNHLMNWIDGFASVIESYLFTGRRYVRPRKGKGFKDDRMRLRGDVRRISTDIKASTAAYGNKGSSGEGYKSQR
ncbi:hypothetical protein MXC99_04125 [Thauera aromatica]|uniref:hypothetical protein n=1 Tax=Thauera aromatica TaxID=59405 RepID=UPI001FFD04B5|nr:hypothetical protein [Thauera aromatica]MCK2087366.1 hypothetical protein [Thauera aromatica]